MEYIKFNKDDAQQYRSDLKYLSDACGWIYDDNGNIVETDDLPSDIQRVLSDLWEESKDGNYCYVANYKGKNGIALVNEYYENEDGKPCLDNYEQAKKVSTHMIWEMIYDIPDCAILLAKEVGFIVDGEKATELAIFAPADISKNIFDMISREFASVAYKHDLDSWEKSDDLQAYKIIDENEIEFMEVRSCIDDGFAIYRGTVDTSFYSEEDVRDIIEMYYDIPDSGNLSELRISNRIIAECLFESIASSELEVIGVFDEEEDAEAEFNKIINGGN